MVHGVTESDTTEMTEYTHIYIYIYNSSQKAALTGKIATLQEAMAPPLPDQISDGSSPGKAGAPACPF